jgi:hypothetical protein
MFLVGVGSGYIAKAEIKPTVPSIVCNDTIL